MYWIWGVVVQAAISYSAFRFALYHYSFHSWCMMYAGIRSHDHRDIKSVLRNLWWFSSQIQRSWCEKKKSVYSSQFDNSNSMWINIILFIFMKNYIRYLKSKKLLSSCEFTTQLISTKFVIKKSVNEELCAVKRSKLDKSINL